MYHSLRTAHLERFRSLRPASIFYASRSYDFDEEQATSLDLTRYAGRADLARRLLRARAEVVEINEPLFLGALLDSSVAVLAVRLRGLLPPCRRSTVVAYAIENLDPFSTPTPRLRSRWRRVIYRAALRMVLSQVDRLAFGSSGAEDAYAPYLRRRTGQRRLVPAVPAPCAACPPLAEEEGGVVFLGAFDERKGLRQLLDAWPHLLERVPDARLHLLGQGDLEALARDAARRPEVSLDVDPSREHIHRVLRSSKVLVLLSQPRATWREQIGLPLVEGLAHGCEVVSTDETGLAVWLREHGHHVVDVRRQTPETVADAMASALVSTRSPAQVMGDLPGEDGRLVADGWMFADVDL